MPAVVVVDEHRAVEQERVLLRVADGRRGSAELHVSRRFALRVALGDVGAVQMVVGGRCDRSCDDGRGSAGGQQWCSEAKDDAHDDSYLETERTVSMQNSAADHADLPAAEV